MSRPRSMWSRESACAFTMCFIPATSAPPCAIPAPRRSRHFAMALALLALFSAAAPAQTAHFSGSIVTLGGGFTSPDGVAVDGAGNVYMTDYATNVVKEIPAGCASSTCVTTLGGGFSNLYGAAVDGGGNVYVADSGHSAIKKVPPGCAASSCVTVQGGIGILIPVGVAVDGSGNVYAGAHGSGEVQEIPLGCTSLGCVTTLGGGFAGVDGVAADGSGNVYVASGSGAVKKMPAGCASSSCVASLGGITSADYVAVDGSGNVYITYGPANEVQELPVGCSSSSCVIGLGSGFNDPSGVAVDGHGNVYVADSNNAAVKELMLKSVDFFSAPVGSAGPVRTLTFTFDATVVISSVRVLTMGAANQDFTNAGTGSCIGLDKHTYGPGDTCTIDVAFSPKWAGTRNGAVILTNPGGGPIATAYIHGVGTGPQVVFTPSAISTLGGDAFVAPNGVAVDGGGNVYMADYPASEVYEIPAGCASFSCVTTLGGGLSNPSEVAVDGAGNVYVAETGHNAIKEMPAGCTSSSCVTTLGGGFSFPIGVAVDGSGNVYVSAHSANTVMEMLPGCASSSCVTTLGGGFSFPIGVAVDGSGNVYVSAHSANTVMEMPPGCASSSCVTTLGGGFFGPEGVAVDGGGNVYVADYGHDLVKEMPPGCATSSCVTTLGGGFTNPASVAVDGSGNVYVADIANTTVTVMPAGCASSSCVTPLGSGFLSPFGVAVDGSGNVYVGDNGNHEVKEIGRATPPSLGFASTQFGATSSDSPKTVTVQNIGNATLTFPLPTTGDNPSVSTNFRWNNTSTCGQTSTSSSTPFTLAEGAICGIAIDFSPTIVASISGSAVLTDNALNVHNATQSISLTGLGNKATPNVSTWPTAGAITYGQTLASSTLTGGAASVPGAFAWSVPTIAPHAGLQSRSVTFTPTDAADYDPVTGYVTVSVKKVTPTVSKWPAASTITYGQTLSSSTLTGATTSVPGAFKWTVPSIVPTAGSQSRSVTFTPTDSTDYNTVIGLTTITVNKATPTVSPWPTASAISYGQTLAASTLTGGAASVPGTF